MKDILKHAYKPTPERFRYSVASAVSQAEQNAPQKAGLNRPARALIAAMGGRLEVESREGEGSRFTVTLNRALP